MFKILSVLTVIAFIAVLGTLLMGAISMAGKEASDRERSNLWMRRRVTMQVIAVILLMLTLYVKSQGAA